MGSLEGLCHCTSSFMTHGYCTHHNTDLPLSPANVTANEVNCSTALLQWSIEPNGHSCIISYTIVVNSTTDSRTLHTDGNTTMLYVTALNHSEVYSFTIVANTFSGISYPSDSHQFSFSPEGTV